MNILLVHNYYKIPGGEDTVFYNEYNLLKDENNVYIYTRNNNEINNNIIKKLLLPINSIFNIKTYKEVTSIIIKNNIEVVHVHNTSHIISYSVLYAAKKCGVPVVNTLHNFRLICPNGMLFHDGKICEKCIKNGQLNSIINKCYRNSFFQSSAVVLNNYLHRISGILRYSYYIFLTEFDKEIFSKHNNFFDNEKVFIKSNFTYSYEKPINNKRKNIFVFAGRLEEIKGFDKLIKAWIKFNNNKYTLVVCGDGPLESWAKKILKDNNVDNVTFEGHINNKKVKDLISESLALIFPSQWYETFGMSIIEAYSVGTPVISNNVGNMKYLVNKTIGLSIDCSIEDNILKAIIEIINTRYNYQEIVEYYQTNYSKKENYKQLIEIYNKIVNKEKK